MFKEYWPTQDYIETLRKNGIFPYSHCATTFLKLSFLFLMFYILQDNIDSYLKICSSFFSNKANLNFFSKIYPLFLAIPFLMLIVCIFSILFQSKYLICSKNIISNIFYIRKENNFGLLHILFSIVVFIVCALLYFLSIYILTGDIASLLNNSSTDILLLLHKSFGKILLMLICIFFFLSLFCFFVGKGKFLIKNRMTKEQYEQEQMQKD